MYVWAQNKIIMGLITYHGDGKSLFKIYIVNVLLTLVTLGIYYPWAKAKLLAYHYAETELENSRFAFLGTGEEIFKGFVKAILIFAVWYGVAFYLSLQLQTGQNIQLFAGMIFVWELVLLLIIPLAIVGSLKYRLSRTTWRGIHMRYTGNVKSMYKVFFKGILFSILTLGIYGPWFLVSIRKEIMRNVKLGNLNFSFEGRGSKYLGLSLGGYLLCIITLGIYAFQWAANLHNFNIDYSRLYTAEERAKLKGKATGLGIFKLQFINLLIVVFTLGLGVPFALVRSLKYYASTVELDGNITFDNIIQEEINDSDATGDSLLDAFELDIV